MDYDLCILGGGPGGYVAAIKAAQSGLKTALVEARNIGGICLNEGCIPTKTLLRTAKLFSDIQDAARYGIALEGARPTIDWSTLMLRKDTVVSQLVGGVRQLLKHNGVEVISGFGTALDPHTVQVGDRRLTCRHLIVATGSSPAMPDTPGLAQAREQGIVIDSTDALVLPKLPKRLIILGGGVIAVEFASLYSGLGTEVVMVQRSPEILKGLDADVRKTIQRHLVKTGVKLHHSTTVKAVSGHTVTLETPGGLLEETGDYILVSTGRTANLKGLEALGLKTAKGFVETDGQMRTNVPGVYAIGDLNGRFMLAHVASAEGLVAVDNILGKAAEINYDRIPSCIYSFPEVGAAGLTEEEARSRGHEVIVSQFPLSANGKALAEGESLGFVKIVADKQYGEVLGIHIVASHATDMIAEAVAVLELEGTVHDLARTVHPHPTLSEIVMEAAHGAVDKPIHIFKKD